MKALPIEAYSNKTYRGCSNGGITERFDRLLLVCEEGFVDVDESNPPENLVVLVDRDLFGEPSPYIRPYADPDPGNVGWMAGGSFASSSDSRFNRLFRFYGAVAVHDRQETQELYDLLSR